MDNNTSKVNTCKDVYSIDKYGDLVCNGEPVESFIINVNETDSEEGDIYHMLSVKYKWIGNSFFPDTAEFHSGHMNWTITFLKPRQVLKLIELFGCPINIIDYHGFKAHNIFNKIDNGCENLYTSLDGYIGLVDDRKINCDLCKIKCDHRG